jgi:hypothetical protein
LPSHINLRYREIETLMPGVEAYQDLASSYGITDVFADNGGKLLQLMIAIGLDHSPGRLGPDALDRLGNEYEVKTLDLDKDVAGFSTSHHLNHKTIEKFRSRKWVFAVYRGIKLFEAYLVNPEDLEPMFANWEASLRNTDPLRTHINNPKIPLKFVREVGETAYLKDVNPPWHRLDVQDVGA